jgi:hypothetical protein
VLRTLVESKLGQTTLIAAAAALVGVALAVASPSSSIRPALTGNFKVGQKLTADNGTWAGTGALAYGYQWYRCDTGGAHCKAIRGATGGSYVVTGGDGGKTIGATVRATDTSGIAAAYSSLVGPIATGLVYATAAPKLSGSAEAGGDLRTDEGEWAVTPQAFAYRWLRCNRNGRICRPIKGAAKPAYKPVAADVAHALVAEVTAKVGSTRQVSLSSATTPVVAEGDSLPAGATALAGGRYSVPIESVALPARLVVAGAKLAKPSTLDVKVTDSRGYAVRGALVQVVAPYGWVAAAKETATGKDGTASFALTAKPGHPPVIVLYVRARKAGDDVLAGVTASRLVSVRPTS